VSVTWLNTMSQRPRNIGRKYYVAAAKRELKLKPKKAEAEKERNVGQEFSRTAIENKKKL